jgi:ornithine cyclodeaminase
MNLPIWITEAEVVSLMNLREAIAALENGLLMEARGEAENMIKTHVAWDHSNLHAIGAAFVGAGVVGTKTWAHTGGGTCPLLILFDAKNGSLKAVIEAFALGQMRTGGISGVATNWLAREDATEMAIIGTGKQALAQIAAVAAVRPLRRVRVFSPRPESRSEFVRKARTELDFEMIEAQTVEEAVADAMIVTTVTRATEPFLNSRMLRTGAHVNAVGAITPDRAEIAQDVFPRCSAVVVDSLPAVQKLSSEFIEYYANKDWDRIKPLSAVLAAGTKRPPSADISMFKAMGMGISDLALGKEIYQRAQRNGVGREIPQPQKAKPRLIGVAA